MNTDTNHTVLERLSQSQLYKDYQRAFGEATGLPLTLSAPDDWHLTHRGVRHENPFCAMLARQNKACGACLQAQHELTTPAPEQSRTVTCFAGLLETAIPLRVGETVIGYLRTGEVLPHTPTAREFKRVVQHLTSLGVKADAVALRDAYFRTPVFTQKQYDSVLQLLQIFAKHLLIVANQVVFQSEHSEMPNIARARAYIAANHAEELSLATVARVANMSTFYFCKQFKKATGISFTDYLSRVRIEKAKEQLLNPNVRVSEVAYEVGFQSLTHFNRVFKKLSGEAPTTFRTHQPLACAA